MGHAHQAISLFLDGRKKIKIPKAKFQSTETSFGDFEWIRNNSECHDLKKLAGSHINLLDAGLLFLPFHSDVLKAVFVFSKLVKWEKLYFIDVERIKKGSKFFSIS